MDHTAKKVIGALAAIFILSVAYYGSYLPLQKSMAFIAAMQNTSNVKTLADFENLFKTPLDMPSPIGQEELVRNTGSSMLGTMQGIQNQPTIDELHNFVTGYYQPILDRGVGMSFGQDVYLIAAINEISFVKTQNPSYLATAAHYYQKAVELGQQRPQGLYGLFDIYRMQGNVAEVQAVSSKILTLWPNDDRTRQALSDYLAQHSGTTPVASPKPSKALKSSK